MRATTLPLGGLKRIDNDHLFAVSTTRLALFSDGDFMSVSQVPW